MRKCNSENGTYQHITLSFLSRIHPKITLSVTLKVCNVHTVNIYFLHQGALYTLPACKVILVGGTYER
jgi:hypothetical protein